MVQLLGSPYHKVQTALGIDFSHDLNPRHKNMSSKSIARSREGAAYRWISDSWDVAKNDATCERDHPETEYPGHSDVMFHCAPQIPTASGRKVTKKAQLGKNFPSKSTLKFSATTEERIKDPSTRPFYMPKRSPSSGLYWDSSSNKRNPSHFSFRKSKEPLELNHLSVSHYFVRSLLPLDLSLLFCKMKCSHPNNISSDYHLLWWVWALR